MKAFSTLFLLAALAPAFARPSFVKHADDADRKVSDRHHRRFGKKGGDASASLEKAAKFDRFEKRVNVDAKEAARAAFRKIIARANSAGKPIVGKNAVDHLNSRAALKEALVTKFAGTLGGGTECNLCVEFMDQFLNELLNIILNGGVVGGCSGLCGLINGSSVESTVCNLLCDAVGIEGFITLIQDADLDPVWMCEELDTCAKTTCTSNCAVIRTVSSGGVAFPVGATVNYTVIFGILSAGVGVSTVQVALQSVEKYDGDYVSGSDSVFIADPQQGFFQASIPIQTFDTDANGNQDNWPAGLYNATVTFCEGMCGSNHNGSGEILASFTAPQITLR